MSNELIEKLRAFAPYASPNAADLMHEAAEALEANAAPAGEREAFEAWFNKEKLPSVSYGNPNILKKPLWPAFQAGAAHQRQQAREVVMPKRKSKPYGKLYMPDMHEGWNACLDEFARLNKGGSHE